MILSCFKYILRGTALRGSFFFHETKQTQIMHLQTLSMMNIAPHLLPVIPAVVYA
jgi:hypothetical protein